MGFFDFLKKSAEPAAPAAPAFPQKYILRFALGPGMENVIGNRISGFCIKR